MPITPANSVEIIVAGKTFRHWSEMSIGFSADSFSTFEFSAPFEAGSKDFRETFRPFAYHPVEVLVDSGYVLSGTLVGVAPSGDANGSTVVASGYAKPGVLADCAPPASAPREFRRLGLRDIATALAEPYGVEVRFEAPEGAKFTKVKLGVEQPCYEFLVGLAQQRNLIISSAADGAMVFGRSIAPGRPVARLTDGVQPVFACEATFGPQDYFSEITAHCAAKRKRPGSRYTVSNPHLSSVLRPTAFTLQDTDPGDVPAAAQAKLGRMFGGACGWAVDVATWNDPSGALWAPNTTVTLLAPHKMIYRETELVIRGGQLHRTESGDTARLELVLPGAFTGEVPEVLPWAE